MFRVHLYVPNWPVPMTATHKGVVGTASYI